MMAGAPEEIGSQDLMGECEITWVVNLAPTDTGCRRVRVKAGSELGAILAAESQFDTAAISALPEGAP